jgi:hypothetical protein
MRNNLVGTPNQTAADTPQPNPSLTPEQFVEQLRVLRAQVIDVAPLTVGQRKLLRNQATLSGAVVQASINVIGASELITQAIGQPAGDVRQLVDESNRWTAAEDELRTMLNGIAGANLIRRQKIAVIAGHAYGLGRQLARDPENAVLVPHVAEVKRLRSLARRKKPAPQAPPAPPPTHVTPLTADAPETPKA